MMRKEESDARAMRVASEYTNGRGFRRASRQGSRTPPATAAPTITRSGGGGGGSIAMNQRHIGSF